MYKAFRKMINDLFNNENFTEWCFINGIKYKCIVSSVDGGFTYTEAGLQNMISFNLDIQITEQNKNNLPKQNDRITFRTKQWKVATVDIDSTLSVVRLGICSVSKGI